MKRYNLFIKGELVWSGDNWPPYPLIDTVAKCARVMGTHMNFTNENFVPISY